MSATQSKRPAKAAHPLRRTVRQLRDTEIDALVARYEEIGKVSSVALEFRISRQTAGKHLSARGIVTPRRMTSADVKIASQGYRAGASAAVIGQNLGFDAQTVLAALRIAGVSIRPRAGHISELE